MYIFVERCVNLRGNHQATCVWSPAFQVIDDFDFTYCERVEVSFECIIEKQTGDHCPLYFRTFVGLMHL